MCVLGAGVVARQFPELSDYVVPGRAVGATADHRALSLISDGFGSSPHRFGMGLVDGNRPVTDGTDVLIPGGPSRYEFALAAPPASLERS